MFTVTPQEQDMWHTKLVT